jgi:hypothetical protein
VLLMTSTNERMPDVAERHPRIKPKRRWVIDEHGDHLLFARQADLRSLPWQHLITASRRIVEGIPTRPGGHTTWCARLTQARLATITWEWTIIKSNVVSFEDILAISSNVCPTSADGKAFTYYECRRALVEIVATFDWISRVQNHLKSVGDGIITAEQRPGT